MLGIVMLEGICVPVEKRLCVRNCYLLVVCVNVPFTHAGVGSIQPYVTDYVGVFPELPESVEIFNPELF